MVMNLVSTKVGESLSEVIWDSRAIAPNPDMVVNDFHCQHVAVPNGRATPYLGPYELSCPYLPFWNLDAIALLSGTWAAARY